MEDPSTSGSSSRRRRGPAAQKVRMLSDSEGQGSRLYYGPVLACSKYKMTELCTKQTIFDNIVLFQLANGSCRKHS